MWDKIATWTKGWRTIVASAAVTLIGLADYLQVLDLRGLLAPVFGDHVASTVMLVLGVGFGTLRYFTTGPLGTKDT